MTRALSLTQADGMVLTNITHVPGSQAGRREETARQCCLAPYPVHMLNVCLESQCHQVLPKNIRTLSNIGHARMGPHMYGPDEMGFLMVLGSESDSVGKRQKALGSTVSR